MTGTFDAKRSDGITDALPGYLFEQRTQICRLMLACRAISFRHRVLVSKFSRIYPRAMVYI